MNGQLDYYQIGSTYSSLEECNKEKAEAKVLVTSRNSGLFCLEAYRD
jgi:hypothetical protein